MSLEEEKKSRDSRIEMSKQVNTLKHPKMVYIIKEHVYK